MTCGQIKLQQVSLHGDRAVVQRTGAVWSAQRWWVVVLGGHK